MVYMTTWVHEEFAGRANTAGEDELDGIGHVLERRLKPAASDSPDVGGVEPGRGGNESATTTYDSVRGGPTSALNPTRLSSP